AVERLPEVVAAAGGSRAFVVTDPGVRRAGVVPPILDRFAPAGLPLRPVPERFAPAGMPSDLFAEAEPNPAASTVERGAASLRAFGTPGTVVVAVGGGSAMDAAKAIDLRAGNDRPGWRVRRRATSGPSALARSGSASTTGRTSPRAARSSRSRRRPGPAPRPTAS